MHAHLFGLEFDAVSHDEVIAACDHAIGLRKRMLIGVANAAKIVNMRRDPMLRQSVTECDVLLADGMSVVWASRLLGSPLPERVTGIDLFEGLLGLAHRRGYRVYLLGATDEVLERVVSVVESTYPQAQIVGARNGYFTDDEAEEVAEEIAASSPDMLFLGITSPKKEIFLAHYGERLQVPVLHGVGGSFDVMAGVTQRAPEAWQRAGMEWAYRLKQEPGRLWKRYLTTNTRFLGLVLMEFLHPLAAADEGPVPLAIGMAKRAA